MVRERDHNLQCPTVCTRCGLLPTQHVLACAALSLEPLRQPKGGLILTHYFRELRGYSRDPSPHDGMDPNLSPSSTGDQRVRTLGSGLPSESFLYNLLSVSPTSDERLDSCTFECASPFYVLESLNPSELCPRPLAPREIQVSGEHTTPWSWLLNFPAQGGGPLWRAGADEGAVSKQEKTIVLSATMQFTGLSILSHLSVVECEDSGAKGVCLRGSSRPGARRS